MKKVSIQFPALPLLESIGIRTERRLDGVMIVAVQHLLESTGSLLASFVQLGVKPRDIHIMGKLYSTHPGVVDGLEQMGVHVYPNTVPSPWPGFRPAFIEDVDRMWRAVAKAVASRPVHTVIVLDDGGRCLARMPDGLHSQLGAVLIAAVEQTTAGLVHTSDKCLRIRVAESAAKRHLESPHIATAVFAKLAAFPAIQSLKDVRAGVVGMGNIGRAIANHLRKSHIDFCTYDIDETKLDAYPGKRCANLRELLEKSDVVFGCSGVDITTGAEWSDAHVKSQILVSCSSEDNEFRSLLCNAGIGASPVSDIKVTKDGADFLILRGGFPVNFDGTSVSVPNEDIQLTRALLLAGVLQAAEECQSIAHGERRLDPAMQSLIVREWLAGRTDRAERRGRFSDIEWIANES